MKLKIEQSITGPLAHKKTLHALERAVEASSTLEEADRAVSSIPSLATYRGGSHIAVHPTYKGRFSHGSERVAIIMED